jgi:hypothetical protein
MSALLFVEGKWLNSRPTYFVMLLDLSLQMALCLVLIYLKLYFLCYLHMWTSCIVLPTKAYILMIFHDETFRMQAYILMSWIRIEVLWFET